MHCRGARVLVVDDDPKFRGFVVQGLTESGLVPDAAENVAAAKARLQSGRYDMVLLDVMMPGCDGRDLLAELRLAGNDVPVILVTARDATEERVEGLQLGADDYVIKPFAFAELLARIDAVVRRRQGAITLGFGALAINPAARKVTCHGHGIELSPKEYDLLLAFVRARGDELTRADLLAKVWGISHDPGTNVVDVFIGRLRKKLAAVDGPTIATVRGSGYRLEENG